MGVNERLIPGAGLLILDLDDVGKSNGAVTLYQVLEGGVLAIIRRLHSVLDL